MIGSSNTFKASSLFLIFFGLQMTFAPDFLMSENFQEGSYNLDQWHYFIFRGAGSAFLTIGGFLWQLAPEADKYMLYSLITFTMTSGFLPFYAQTNLPVAMPKHLIPVLGCVFLIACHVGCLINPGKTGKKQ